MSCFKKWTRLGLFAAILPFIFSSTACGQALPDLAEPSVPPTNGKLTIEVLDVGQGDSILIQTPEGKTALIDAGPSNHVVKLLKDRGVRTIDLVIVSHHHSDHYGGMRAVIQQFHPSFFMASNGPHTTATYLKLLKEVKESTMKTIHPTNESRTIELGSAILTVFPEAPNDPKEENNNSIGIRLDYGTFTMLLTGDSEEKERRWWVKTCPDLIEDANVLKLAHHGSRNGTDASWLNMIRPELAIASLGAGNDYGHPHPETVALLARDRIPFLRTDQDGTVVITTDGNTWRYNTPDVASRSKPAEDESIRRTAKTSTHSRSRR